MSKLIFNPTLEPTLGVELELALADEETMALSSSIQRILDRVPAEFAGAIKPELMQCYLEINTGVCHTAAEAEADLRRKIEVVESITDEIGVRLLWTATHPFSLWRDQVIVPTERYKMLLSLLQDTARQLITFGLHVHVGVESGDKAVMICDRIMQHLPVLLALSCNSPCWDGRVTGLHSSRSKIMEGLPTAGLPTLMRNWSEYTWLINHLVATGFINTIREIWWDVRPHHNFGTVEIRVCDMPGSLSDSVAIAALIQCLVKALSDEIDQGTYQHDCHPMIVRQNKWRACRYGLDAQLVDSYTYEVHSARELVQDIVRWLEPTAAELNCQDYLQRAGDLATGPSWADRQLALLEKTGDPMEAVRQMTRESRKRE
jgi:glutamate---cysteine ligase / carboxylate-amine ligase